MRINLAACCIQLVARRFEQILADRGKCALNLKLDFKVFDDHRVKVEFFSGSNGHIVHYGLYDQCGILEYGLSEESHLYTERTIKDLLDHLSTEWMKYKLDCMIELGIIKKRSGVLFEMDTDPVLIKMQDLFINKDRLSLSEVCSTWEGLGLNISFEEMLVLENDLQQYK